MVNVHDHDHVSEDITIVIELFCQSLNFLFWTPAKPLLRVMCRRLAFQFVEIDVTG